MVVEACLGLGAGGVELVFHGTEFQFEKMKEFWSWTVVMVARRWEGTRCH